MASPRDFGPFRLDLDRGVLLRDGQPVALGQRALAMLAILAENPGRAVPKAEIMDRVWPGTFVEEANLSVQIAALRRALGETSDGQSWILTVPRLGYRLLAQATAPVARRPEPTSQPRLVVLPFQVLGEEAGPRWFADGVVEDIVAALSRFRSFTVVARSAAPSERGSDADARRLLTELGVPYGLTGTVRRSGDRLRLTAQLLDGESGTSLWSKQLDGTIENVFEFQDHITTTVAGHIEPRITRAEIERSRRERPGSVAAYDVALRAQALIATESERDNAEATALLETALQAEPDNVLLLAHAARAIESRIALGWPPYGPDDRRRCAELARQALERAGDDATLLSICGISLFMGAGEYELGLAAIEAAVEANPNHLIIVNRAGIAHAHLGHLEQAMRHFERSRELGFGDPFGHAPLSGIALVHLLAGANEEALAWALRALAMRPGFDAAHWVLIAANANLGRLGEAQRRLAEFQRLRPGISMARIRGPHPPEYLDRLAPMVEGLRLAGLPES